MKQLDTEAKYIRSKTFWDVPDVTERQFNNWMIENADLKILAIDTSIGGYQADEGYSYFRTTTVVIYLITEDMHEQDVKKKKERDEWRKNLEKFE